jgi:hypothetical protein
MADMAQQMDFKLPKRFPSNNLQVNSIDTSTEELMPQQNNII